MRLKPVSDEYKVDICNEFTAEVTKYMPFNPTGDMEAIEEFLEKSLLDVKVATAFIFVYLTKRQTNF